MSRPDSHNKQSFDRRSFISNTLKLAMLGSIIAPMEQACNNKPSKPSTSRTDTSNRKKNRPVSKKIRKKWSHETLVMNSKTNVLHFPTSKLYAYYDEIVPKHLEEVGLAVWAARLKEPVRLNKDQSGNILEILAMQGLNKGINDESLSAAMDTLSKAFTKECENSKGINSNTMNFRIHELMLQLVTLNKSIPAGSKWQTFIDKVKKPGQLRKRQKWMEAEANFNERVKYIQYRQNDYITRLTKRAARYFFT